MAEKLKMPIARLCIQIHRKNRRRELTEGLSEYCKLDTLAMVRLAWFFEGREFDKGGEHAS